MINSTYIVNALEQEGFAIVNHVVDASTVLDLIKAVERLQAIPMVCAVPRGGVLLMRPLLLHSSSAGFEAFSPQSYPFRIFSEPVAARIGVV